MDGETGREQRRQRIQRSERDVSLRRIHGIGGFRVRSGELPVEYSYSETAGQFATNNVSRQGETGTEALKTILETALRQSTPQRRCIYSHVRVRIRMYHY